MPYMSLGDYEIYWVGLGFAILVGVVYGIATLIFKAFKK